MRLARGAALLSLTALAGIAACTGAGIAPGKRGAASNSATPPAPERPPYESPARWIAHPYPPTYATDSWRLADGSCLLLEGNGQRWISAPHRAKPEPVIEPGPMEDTPPDPDLDVVTEDASSFFQDTPISCDGDGRAAADRAPETVLGLVRWPGAYGVVGLSGTIHVATSPLGPFVRRIAPPEKLIQAKSTAGVVLAVSDTGKLYRYTEEAGYKRVDLGDVHAIRVVTAKDGRAAVLAAPEALFTTVDAGLTFQRSSAPVIGVQRIAREKGGVIVAEGVLTTLAWDPRKDGATFEKSDARIPDADPPANVAVGRSPSGNALAVGRAALDGERYVDLSTNDAGEWKLYRGSIEGPLHETTTGLTLSSDNLSVPALGGSGDVLATAVVRYDESSIIAEVQRSVDGGKTFQPVEGIGIDNQGALSVAVEPGGTVLVTGLCLQPDRGVTSLDPDSVPEELSCAAGPIVIPPGGGAVLARLPSAGALIEAPAFSPDGKSAYLLLTDGSDARTSLLVSHDSGRTFAEREIEVDDDQRRIGFITPSISAIRVAEDGTVGMELEATGDMSGPVWVTTDADGKLLRIGEPPVPGSILAGFGSRVIAIDPSHREDDTEPYVSESLNGGLTWAPVPWPPLLRETPVRRGEVSCGAAGCVIGEQLTRVGWGVAEDRTPPFTPAKADTPGGMRATIACEPRPGSTWTRIEDVERGLGPDQRHAARGAAAWMMATHNEETGEWTSVTAAAPSAGGEPKITTKRLLGPVPKGTRWAVSNRPQIEGISLARAPLGPMDPSQGGAPWTGRRIRDLEVAWVNLEEGVTGHATLPDAGTFRTTSITVRDSTSRFSWLTMAMLSVSPGGMFVRSMTDKEAFFVEATGKVRKFIYPDLPENLLLQARLSQGDAVNVDGTFIAGAELSSNLSLTEAFLFLRPPAKGSAPDAPWTPWIDVLSPSPDYESRRYAQRSWTYDDKHLATWTLYTVPAARYAIAWMRRISKDGTLAAPQRVPTPYDLDAQPRGCTPEEHKSLPRYVFDPDDWGTFRGVRHAILIHEDGAPTKEPPPPAVEAQIEADRDPMSSSGEEVAAPSTSIGDVALISTGVVLRGRGNSACLDAIAGRDPTRFQGSVLLAGDLASGWYFRKAGPKPQPGKKPVAAPRSSTSMALEARPLTCHWAPEKEAPPAVRAVAF